MLTAVTNRESLSPVSHIPRFSRDNGDLGQRSAMTPEHGGYPDQKGQSPDLAG